MKDQKQIIILIIIAASLVSFLAGYFLTQPARQSADILQQQRGSLIDRFSEVTNNATPTPLPPGLLQATSDVALSATSAPDNNSIFYYHPTSGFVSKLDLETRANTLVSNTQLNNLTNVIWSPNKNRVITIFRSLSGPVYKYFDYTTRDNGSLGINIKDAVFSPDNQKIALVRSSGDDSNIEITDFHGKNSQVILKTRLNNIKLAWPSTHLLSFIANDADTGAQSLYTLSDTGDLNQLVGGENSLAVRWSPDGSEFLYSVRENRGVSLRLFNIASRQSKPVPVQTNAVNCAWLSGQHLVICAVETEGETSITRINLATNVTKILFSNLIISPKDIFMSHLEDFVIITSAGDQSIWELKLAN